MSSVLFLINKTLGKYKILEHIGHGGMAEVYRGQHFQLDRMVAIKVLHPFLADEEGFVIRFQREAQIVATLRHPNIVQVYDFDHNEELNIYYMVMEFIDGPTLKSRMSEGPFSFEETARIGAAMADALDYAHQRGMVHRDVKPANIMFTAEGMPVLTDFGIAKMLTLSGLTASGAMVGTPAYMAPEVGMGKPGSASSDMYSLGVVLYQMVTGQLPFDSDSPMGMVMQHINDPPPPPSQFNPDLPPALERVILQSLEKQPQARFSRAKDMAGALRHAMSLETPVKSTPAVPLPADTGGVSADVEEEEDERLLRTWPLAAAATPSAAAKAETPAKAGAKPRAALVSRLLRAFILLLAIVIVAGAAWVSITGQAPPALERILPLWLSPRRGEVVEAIDVTPPLETPGPGATLTSTPSTPAAVAPGLTATPVLSCTVRLRLEQVRFEPDDVAPPGTTIIAYITLRNSGECAWPSELRLSFVSGEQMGAPDALPIKALPAGERAQVVLPLQAPLDFGQYASTWQVRQVDGQAIGSPIVLTVEVSDLPTPTPQPKSTATREPTRVPLALEAPALLEWRQDAASGLWYGTVAFQATGGLGNYRYYHGEIRDDTLMPDGKLSFQWRRCVALPLRIWVISGDDVVDWAGAIDYPAPEDCK